MVNFDWQRLVVAFLLGCLILSCVCFEPGSAATLSNGDFDALAARCAPSADQNVLKAVATTESGLDPLAIHDNTTGMIEKPTSLITADADAVAWVARGDSVDLGLMQINSGNLSALNMTPSNALDPCVSLAGGASVLQAAYGSVRPEDSQVALLMALSRYNTGSPLKGIMNGYARKVIDNGDNAGVPSEPVLRSSADLSLSPTDPDAPPAWDVWANAKYEQRRGASWIVNLSSAPAPPAQTVLHPTGAPAPDLAAATTTTSQPTQLATRSP